MSIREGNRKAVVRSQLNTPPCAMLFCGAGILTSIQPEPTDVNFDSLVVSAAVPLEL